MYGVWGFRVQISIWGVSLGRVQGSVGPQALTTYTCDVSVRGIFGSILQWLRLSRGLYGHEVRSVEKTRGSGVWVRIDQDLSP